MTTLTLAKWGNAQAIRIPKDMREQVGMADGSRVEATVKDGAIVLHPIHDNIRIIHVPRLATLFHGRTKERQTTEDPFGDPVGMEAL